MQYREQRHRHRLGEVERPGCLIQDRGGVTHIGVDVGTYPGRFTDQQRPGMRQHERIVVAVDNTAVRRHLLGDLMGAVRGRQARVDIEELANASVASEVPDHLGKERAVRPRTRPLPGGPG